MTIFKDEFASRCKHDLPTLPQIAAGIRTTTAKTKGELPLHEAATVWRPGDRRNCLRHNANVLEISGIEGEHDKGTLTLD